MGFWTCIFAIVVVGCVSGVIKSFIHARSKGGLGDGGRAFVGQVKELQAVLKNIEKRVGNLEAIVTRTEFDLNREFAALAKEENRAA